MNFSAAGLFLIVLRRDYGSWLGLRIWARAHGRSLTSSWGRIICRYFSDLFILRLEILQFFDLFILKFSKARFYSFILALILNILFFWILISLVVFVDLWVLIEEFFAGLYFLKGELIVPMLKSDWLVYFKILYRFYHYLYLFE